VPDAASAYLRVQPTEAKGAQRVEIILDATAGLIDEVGYGAMSISMIAKRCTMSGPGIYRYFDDLTAVVRALAARNLERFIGQMSALLDDEAMEWQDALTAVVQAYCHFFRNEPGFRWLRLGDSVDRFLISTETSNRSLVAELATDLFFNRYAVDARDDLLEHVEVIVEICDALLARAFQSNPDGDDFYINECTDLVIRYLGDYLEKPH
jgi:AcrR family transcriptional regulator